MSDLDDKLRDIVKDKLVSYVNPYSMLPDLLDSSVSEIKQAFTDEGYINLANVQMKTLMSGKEWYDKLMAEVERFNYDNRGSTDIDTHYLEDVAKRASGVESDTI